MMPRPAQYLLRFDDLCPTMMQRNWAEFEAILREFAIQPILAVVPQNRDPALVCGDPDPEFWDRLCAWEQAGAAIALHGYEHVCGSKSGGLLGLHRTTEFAGIDEESQQRWIHEGLETLRGHGLHPRLWVAPRHGFDRVTLNALQAEGIHYLSDGFAKRAYVRNGLTWIPQQLWAPVAKSEGLWTICFHSNTASSETLTSLRRFLQVHAKQVTSFDQVASGDPAAPLRLGERVCESVALWRLRAKCKLKDLAQQN